MSFRRKRRQSCGEIPGLLAPSRKYQSNFDLLVDPNSESLNLLIVNMSKAESLTALVSEILRGFDPTPKDTTLKSAREISSASTIKEGRRSPSARQKAAASTRSTAASVNKVVALPAKPVTPGSRYDREELYEKVWKVPMLTLAKEYGVSNVALAKACRKRQVPVPGRGYWAKKAAGQPVPDQPPLQELLAA